MEYTISCPVCSSQMTYDRSELYVPEKSVVKACPQGHSVRLEIKDQLVRAYRTDTPDKT